MPNATYQSDIILNAIVKVNNAEAGINKLKNSLSKLKIPDNLDSSFKKSFSNLEGILAKYKNQLERGFNTKSDVSAFSKTGKELDAELSRISKNFEQLTGKEVNFRVKTDEILKAEKELQLLIEQKEQLSKSALKFEISGGKSGINDIEALLKKLQDVSGNTKTGEYITNAFKNLNTGDIKNAVVQLDKATASCKRFGEEKQKAFKEETGFDIATAIQKVVTELDGAEGKFGDVNTKIDETKSKLSNFEADQVKKACDYAKELEGDFLNSGEAIKRTDTVMQDFARSTFSASQQIEQLQQSTQYFFSLRNMINLLKRGIDQAVDSVKNLDKAMTETAVVTEFSVSDMWAKLPEYTDNANKLGATIQDMYESTTLYYQQGLNTEQAMSIATETMKMARIAGLEAADATDMMTAALRGFNMEIDNASAEHINDVYSNLAAKTASNTKELGTAMQRTASIAHSAGMSFEGTAAFLAQAIETTREPAENLGTAMKTIVARFQELKKNPLEITEVDGEEVSYNKVDTALQSIGVSLKDTNGQFRDLDKVFLDISEKWDSLTQTQQRYIATTAAGSRQQSRFIAMMSNYKRTTELMSYANDSAGASQEQFGKTLESFEAKVNKLRNAWQEFTMGIANDKLVKGAVDAGTSFLTVVNKLIDSLTKFDSTGISKSILSILAAFTGLKMGGKFLNSAIGGLGGLIDPKSGGFGKGMKTGAIGAGADRITTPILSKLGDILNAVNNIKNKGVGVDKSSNAVYEDRNKALKELVVGGKGTNLSNVREQFKGLNAKDQQRLFQTNRGTMNALQRSAYEMMDKAYSDNPKMKLLGKTIQSDIFKGMAKGSIEPKVGLKALGNPASWGAIAGTDAAKRFSATYQAEIKQLSLQAREEAYKKLEIPEEKRNAAGLKELGKTKDFGGAYRGNLEQLKKYFSGEIEGTLTGVDKLANRAGAVGDAFIGAGQSISSFGYILSQVGGPIGMVGSGLQSLGGIVTNFGMAIAGIGSAISGASTALAAMETTLGAIALPLTAIVAALAAAGYAFYRYQKNLADIKSHAEEVVSKFEEIKNKTTEGISALEQYRSELAQLSKGVDINGNNVSLDTSDYDRYKEIVTAIAEINPEIVKGYNAQGLAIIDNNTALEETLRLLKEQQEQNVKNYTAESSLQKLINNRNIDSGYKKATKAETKNYGARFKGTGFQKGDIEAYLGSKNSITGPFANQVNKTVNELLKIDLKGFDVEQILSQYQINLNKLQAGEQSEINKFVQNQKQIETTISNSLSNLGGEMEDSLINSFSQLGEATDEFEEAIQPIYENLLTYIGQSPLIEKIPTEFTAAINAGLKEISGKDLSADEMHKAADVLLKDFELLGGENSKYVEAIKIATEAQDKFAESLNASEYMNEAKKATELLNEVIEENVDKTTVYGQALSEFLTNQIERINKFTTSGAASLSEALNTAIDDITAAEGAYESFQEATKKDFFTAAEGMKSIYDDINATYKDSLGTEYKKHKEGKGDKTFWTGAEALLGDKAASKSKKTVNKYLKDLEPMLREGQEGWEAFYYHIVDLDKDTKEKLAKEGVEFDKNGFFSKIPEDAWGKVAEELHMSEETLTALLNKGRQFADINFTNVKEVRKALSTSDIAVKGKSKEDGGEGNLYIKKSELKNQLIDAGYTPKEANKEIKQLRKEGIKTIPSKSSLRSEDKATQEAAKKAFKDMGISDLDSLIQVLGDTGTFNQDEIWRYAKSYLGKDNITKGEFETAYQDYVNKLENPLLAEQNDINSNILTEVTRAVDLLAEWGVHQGVLTEDAKKGKQIQKEVSGGSGVDTLSEHFALGQGTNGKALSAENYQKTKQSLEEQLNAYNEYLDLLQKGRAEAEAKGYANEVAEFDKEIALTSDSIKTLSLRLQQGRDAAEKTLATDFLSNYDWKSLYDSPADAFDTSMEKIIDQLQTDYGLTKEKATEKATQVWEEYISGIQGTDIPTSEIKKEGEEKSKNFFTNLIEGILGGVPTNLPEGYVSPNAYDPNKNKLPSKPEFNIENKEAKFNVDTEEGQKALESITEVGNAAFETINKTAHFNVKVSGSEKLNKPETKTEQTVQYKVDDSNVDKETQKISNTHADIIVGAATKTATDAVNALVKKVDKKSAAIEVSMKQVGDWVANITVKKSGKTVGTVEEGISGAKGINNRIPSISIPQFGSLAAGSKHGRVGPKGKGGLTLTGEKGFEIAWLPDESKSMILGAGGPQMVNLPSNAVVYSHEQSKDIIKRKSIPAGSHSADANISAKAPSRYTREHYIQSAAVKESNESKKKTKTDKAHAKEITKILKVAGTVSVWWENITRQVADVQRKSEKNQKAIESLLKTVGTTFSDINNESKDYVNNLKKIISLSKEEEQQANAEIANLDYGDNKYTKKVKDAEDKLKKAKKTKSKKDDKTAKKELKKAQQEAVNNTNNMVEISYEQTKKITKKKKGKKKKTTTKTENVKDAINLSDYIYQDANGVLQIDQGKITNIAKTNKSKAEAIKEAAEKAINDEISKLNSAEDARIRAEEELEQFYNDMYESFYQWDRTITEVYLLGQQLQTIAKKQNIGNAIVENELAKLEAGFGNSIDSLETIKKALHDTQQTMVDSLTANTALINAAEAEYKDFASLSHYTEKFIASPQSTQAQNDYNAAKFAFDFLEEIGMNADNFDYQKAVDELYGKNYANTTYDAIKDVLDKINEKQEEYLDAIIDTYGSLTDYYELLEEYQSYMADFEKDLLSGIEEQTEKEINRLEKLNSSITKAMKDLLDEVKSKLEERRRQEDNKKTEQDISQKQQRLAALRADTSGGHQVEIAQLEKEIADAQQDYQRSLEDQLLDRLQQQADEAEKQRERQIEMLQAGNEIASQLGDNVEEVKELLKDPKANYEAIRSAWLTQQGYDDLKLESERKQLEEQFESTFAKYLGYHEQIEELQSIGEIVSEIEKTVADKSTNIPLNSEKTTAAQFHNTKDPATGASAPTSVKEARELSAQEGRELTFAEFRQGGYTAAELAKGFSKKEIEAQGWNAESLKSQLNFSDSDLVTLGFKEGAENKENKTDDIKNKQAAYNQALFDAQTHFKQNGFRIESSTFKRVKETANALGKGAKDYLKALADKTSWYATIKAAKAAGFSKYRMAKTWSSKAFKEAFNGVYGKGQYKKVLEEATKRNIKAYATGGLASSTGPAWLDGTPSKPELVLNAQDTKNFLALKDILAHVMNSAGNTENTYGNNTYEININVEKLTSDYDVDKVAQRVKKIIVDDSSYRNVTQVRKFR